MKVYVVVEHYDRGSDEVAVRGVFSTLAKAQAYIAKNYKGWKEPGEDDMDGGYIRDGYYADITDSDLSNRVFIEQKELN